MNAPTKLAEVTPQVITFHLDGSKAYRNAEPIVHLYNSTSVLQRDVVFKTDKQGIAPSFRWGIGTPDEFYVSAYLLRNNNGINYGLPWLRASSTQATANPSGLITGIAPNAYYGAASDYNAGSAA